MRYREIAIAVLVGVVVAAVATATFFVGRNSNVAAPHEGVVTRVSEDSENVYVLLKDDSTVYQCYSSDTPSCNLVKSGDKVQMRVIAKYSPTGFYAVPNHINALTITS